MTLGCSAIRRSKEPLAISLSRYLGIEVDDAIEIAEKIDI